MCVPRYGLRYIKCRDDNSVSHAAQLVCYQKDLSSGPPQLQALSIALLIFLHLPKGKHTLQQVFPSSVCPAGIVSAVSLVLIPVLIWSGFLGNAGGIEWMLRWG